MCQSELPGTLSDSHPGCVIFCLCLARFHSVWLKDALCEARKTRNLELFQKKMNRKVTTAEENSEVNRFLGSAIYSAMKKVTSASSTHLNKISTNTDKKRILMDVMLRERDIDNECMDRHYDGHMSLLSRGGLTLVSRPFFEFGKNILNKVRSAFDTEALEQDSKTAFKKGKKTGNEQRSPSNRIHAAVQGLVIIHRKCGISASSFFKKSCTCPFCGCVPCLEGTTCEEKRQCNFATKTQGTER